MIFRDLTELLCCNS